MTRLYCVVEPQAIAKEAMEKAAASGLRGSPQGQQHFQSSSHHPRVFSSPALLTQRAAQLRETSG